MSSRLAYPRPEYPRPDFQRGTIEGKDWLNLNGPWQFRFDGDKNGLEQGWHLPEQRDWREQIIVPFCWESLAAWGEGETAGNENYYATKVFRDPLNVDRSNHCYLARYEVGWYRRKIKVPASESWMGKRIILKVGAADFFTDCWCNGQHVGHHEGGYTPFEFDITDHLNPAPDGGFEAILVFRVEDPMDNSQQPVGKQWHWYTPTSGIWQTVFLEPREVSHIDCFKVETNIDDKTATFKIRCNSAPDNSEIVVYLIPPVGQVEVARIPVLDNACHKIFSIPHPYLWNPNQPYLYKVVFKLQHQGRQLDYVRSYFGMRKIDAGPSEDPKAPAVLRLNNVPRYLRGALYQSYFPDGVYTAGDVSTLKNDIESAKKFGFNFLRVHIKIDDPLFLYYADKLGMMLMCDFPNFGEGGDTALGRARFEEMMRAAIKRDYNHPSIIAWCVFNETWGFGGQVELIKHFPEMKGKTIPRKFDATTKPPGAVSATAAPASQPPPPAPVKIANASAHVWVQRMWSLTKELDPTRLVEDMSVVQWDHLDYYAHGDTDINSWHFYIDDYYRAKEHIEKIVGQTYAGSNFNYAPGFSQRSQPLINSEYGGVGALDGNRDVSWTFKFLTNELRRHGQLSAYIFTELHDVEWEYNGFLNYDRTPKDFGYDPKFINESDVIPIDAPPIAKYKVGSTVTIPVMSSHYSTVKKTNIHLKWSMGGMDTSGRVLQDIASGICPIEFPHRRVAQAHRIELQLPDRPMLCGLRVEAFDEDGTRVAANFIHLMVIDGPLAPHEEADRSLILRAFPDQWADSNWSLYQASREEAQKLGYAFGGGHGFFEWHLPVDGVNFNNLRRIRFLCEASSRRVDTPQTDDDHYPTALHVAINDVPILHQIVVDHPHDARGVLSYLEGGKGAYGYLVTAFVEGQMLRRILENVRDNRLRLRCTVPSDELAIGGLTLYGGQSGRYPITITLLLEW